MLKTKFETKHTPMDDKPKTIALFGGSFNPPHPAHFEMAKYIHETLGVDEVWFLFSVNWQKDEDNYESMVLRREMGEMLKKHYPDSPFIMSDIEEEIGTHMTSAVLKALKQRFPQHHFIWFMGADNLASFHTWEDFEDIIENTPIAIVDRPQYSEKAKNSFTAQNYAHIQTQDPQKLATAQNGWCILDNPKIDMSSSNLLKELRSGKRNFNNKFQDVADLIIEKGLYGVKTTSSKGLSPNPKS